MRSTRSRSRSARDDALLVAGELEVDVELDVRERRRSTGARAPRRASARASIGVLVVVGEDQRRVARRRAAWRAGRRTRSCRRPPPARRRTTRGVLPGAIRSAPLWPTRLSADIPGTRRSCGCRPTGRAPGCVVAAARAGAAGPVVDLLVARGCPRAGRLLHARARGVDDRGRLLVGDVAGAAPRVDLRGAARLRPPQVADAGDGPLVEHGVADRARGVVLAQTAEEALVVELGGEDVRARGRRSAGRCACASRSSARARVP